jgi:uncharacterized protein (DUF302 family)
LGKLPRERRFPVTARQPTGRRLSVRSSKPFEAVVAAFEAALGHPEMRNFQTEIRSAGSYSEMESIVQRALGSSGFMEIARLDLGEILRKEPGLGGRKSLRFLIGNPLVMKELVKHVADAASYAPVTVLIDERPDGVHLSYDPMAGFLAPYGDASALRLARDLDSKVESLLRKVAA